MDERVPGDPDDDTVIVNDQEAAAEEDDDSTIVVPRGAPPPDEDDTVSMSDEGGDDEATVLVRTETPDDDTVIVDRAPFRAGEDDDPTVIVARGAAADDEDPTVIVPRAAPAVDADPTVIVAERRAAAPVASDDAPPDPEAEDDGAGDSTVQVPRAEPTVRVERGGSDLPTRQLGIAGSSPVKPVMAAPRKRRRSELRPAPVPSGFGGMPLVASGPGAVSSYRTRRIAPPPAQPGVPSGSHAPRRELGGVASVSRRSRLASILALGSSAAAFVLLAGALVWAVESLLAS